MRGLGLGCGGGLLGGGGGGGVDLGGSRLRGERLWEGRRGILGIYAYGWWLVCVCI